MYCNANVRSDTDHCTASALWYKKVNLVRHTIMNFIVCAVNDFGIRSTENCVFLSSWLCQLCCVSIGLLWACYLQRSSEKNYWPEEKGYLIALIYRLIDGYTIYIVTKQLF